MTLKVSPLPERMRPVKLEDIVGQKHLTGSDGVFIKFLKSGIIPSVILWGPPGTGKTTLAQVLANGVGLPFFSLSAVNAGVKEVREVIAKAEETGKSILFIDEIHRFNKAQQDSLLHAVESGKIILIGATTENPSFEVIRPLLSRCQIYILNPLGENDMMDVLIRAIHQDIILSTKNIEIKETGKLFTYAGGDARKLLNLLDLISSSQNNKAFVIEDSLVEKVALQKIAVFDKGGEWHYDIISAFIKSIRGSDPNAALYWLARMVEGGEDPKFIARRMIILASEDIGNANPNAVLIAVAAFDAVEKIGYPECTLNLAQAAVYLASSTKSNASYIAIKKAITKVRETGDLPVPLHLRNAPTAFMKDMDYGKGYRYVHDYEGNFTDQEYLPELISGFRFYEPGSNQRENEMRKYLKEKWKDKYGY